MALRYTLFYLPVYLPCPLFPDESHPRPAPNVDSRKRSVNVRCNESGEVPTASWDHNITVQENIRSPSRTSQVTYSFCRIFNSLSLTACVKPPTFQMIPSIPCSCPDGGVVETKMRSGPFYSALTRQVIIHDSNAKFQCVIGVTHNNAPYSVGVQLLGCSSFRTGVYGAFG